jgi:hypothetical protein
MFCEYDTLSRKNPALFRKSSDSRFLCNSARHSVCPLQILYWSALVWNSEVCDTIGSSLRLWLKRPPPNASRRCLDGQSPAALPGVLAKCQAYRTRGRGEPRAELPGLQRGAFDQGGAAYAGRKTKVVLDL